MTRGPAPCSGAPNFDLDSIVAALRDQRRASDADGSSHIERPSRDALAQVVRDLRAALFPAHYGPANLTETGIDFFVGHTLDNALRALTEQALRELRFGENAREADRIAAESIRTFATRLPAIRDATAAMAGDPAAKSLDEVLACYPGMTAMMHHRVAHELYGLGLTLIARSIAEVAHSETGIDLHPGAQVGPRFFIDHGTGVVIGETAVIGAGVRIYQGVTLGARSFPTDATGALVKGAPRHPKVEDDVVIYAGATVLGRITIGRGSSIGGNVWLTRSVAPGSFVSQAQARSDAYMDGAGI